MPPGSARRWCAGGGCRSARTRRARPRSAGGRARTRRRRSPSSPPGTPIVCGSETSFWTSARMSCVVRTRHVVGHVDAEPLVQLVAADLGQVVALGSKKSERSRLRALSSVGGSPGRCFLKTSISASSSRVVVPGADLFHAVEREFGHLPLIAENLGHITPPVHRLRRRARVARHGRSPLGLSRQRPQPAPRSRTTAATPSRTRAHTTPTPRSAGSRASGRATGLDRPRTRATRAGA